MSEKLSTAPAGVFCDRSFVATWGRAAVVLLLVGSTIGTFLDGTHTHSDTIRYTTPVFWLMAWWTPLIFALGSLTTGLSYPLMERILKRPSFRRPLGMVVLANAFFYSAYVLSGYLPVGVIGKTIVLLALWGVLWFVCDRTFVGVVVSLITAAWGPLFESFLIRLGEFHYVDPNLFGVTSWLPVLYAIAAIGNGHLGKALVDWK